MNRSGLVSLSRQEMVNRDYALVRLQTALLVICSATPNMTGSYVCMLRDHTTSLNSTVLRLSVLAPSSSPHPFPQFEIILGVFVSVFLLVTITVLVLCVLVCFRAYCHRGKVSMSMGPTAALRSLSSKHLFWPVSGKEQQDDLMEFPRDRLEFVSLLGMCVCVCVCVCVCE